MISDKYIYIVSIICLEHFYTLESILQCACVTGLNNVSNVDQVESLQMDQTMLTTIFICISNVVYLVFQPVFISAPLGNQ